MAYYLNNNDDDPNRAQGVTSSGAKATDVTGGMRQSATSTINTQSGMGTAGSGTSADGIAGVIVPGDVNGGTYTPPQPRKTGGTSVSASTGNGTAVSAVPTASTATASPTYSSYEDMFRAMNPQKSPEQQRRDERKARASMVASAIGDGLRALSDIYFASRGAKIQRDPKSDLTPKAQARFDALRAERDKNRDAWTTGLMKARQNDRSEALAYEKLEDARKKQQREADRQKEQDEEKKRATQKKEQQEDQRLRNDAERIAAQKARNEEQRRHNVAVESGKGKSGKGGSSSGGGKSGGKGKTQKRDYGREYINLMSDPRFTETDRKYERMQRRGQITAQQRQRSVVEELNKK